VVIHELGHNFGLLHSHALACPAGTGSCASGVTIEYGDTLDVMGAAVPPRHFNSAQKERLGWLTVPSVSGPGQTTLTPYTIAGGTRAVKIPGAGGDTFYAEYRTPRGFDTPIAAAVPTGVVLHLRRANEVYLLDQSPPAGSWSNPVLVPGMPFADPVSPVRLSVVSATGLEAVLQVGAGTPPPPTNLLFADAFTRPDGALGNGWQVVRGLPGIGGGEVVPGGVLGLAIQPALGGSAAVRLSGTFARPWDNGARLGLVVRYVDPGHYTACLRTMGSTSQGRVIRVEAGREVVLARLSVPPPGQGVRFDFSCTVTGTRVVAGLGDIAVAVDGAAAPAGAVGFLLDRALRLDDFRAVAP
jgi:hypothetical protein